MIIEAVHTGLLAQPQAQKPSPYYVYVTELASCPRAYALKQQMPAKPFGVETLLTFSDGNAQEDSIIEALKLAGVVHETQVAVKLEVGKITISGRIDAVVGRGDEKIALEIKSASPKVFEKVLQHGVQGQHRWQLVAYMVFGGFARGILLYKNRASPQMLEFEISPTDAEISQMQARPALFEAALEWGGVGLPLAHLEPKELTDTRNVCQWCVYKVHCFA